MDEMRLTTSQLLALTGQQPRTLSTWLSRRWLIPYEQGGGKGRQNSFDLFASTWAVMLNEIFRIWPHADTPVTMFVGTTPEGKTCGPRVGFQMELTSLRANWPTAKELSPTFVMRISRRIFTPYVLVWRPATKGTLISFPPEIVLAGFIWDSPSVSENSSRTGPA